MDGELELCVDGIKIDVEFLKVICRACPYAKDVINVPKQSLGICLKEVVLTYVVFLEDGHLYIGVGWCTVGAHHSALLLYVKLVSKQEEVICQY